MGVFEILGLSVGPASLLGVFKIFGGCLQDVGASQRRGAQMCAFGILGLSCEAPAALGFGFWG